MWSRIELKNRAKNVIRRCYLPAVLVCLISMVLSGEFDGSESVSRSYKYKENHLFEYNTGDDDELDDSVEARITFITRNVGRGIAGIVTGGLSIVFMIAGVVFSLLYLLVMFLIGSPILVGSKRFFMTNRERRAGVGDILYVFKSGCVVNVILTIIIMKVKVFLWTLLLVVPGIVKSYEYMMIPYILSENPGISQRRAFELSREMMNGQKMNAFVLDISFFFWKILGAVTFGLANILYVNPYMASTKAELYSVLRQDMLKSGRTNTYELPGYAGE